MAPTRRCASPIFSLGKLFTGAFLVPTIALNLAALSVISIAGETSNKDRDKYHKIPGKTPKFTSSGFFQAFSMIVNKGILGGSVNLLILNPAIDIVSAFAPQRRRELGVSEVDPQDGGLPSPGVAVASTLHSQLSPPPVSRSSLV